jgi:PncC family amidohydrolase
MSEKELLDRLRVLKARVATAESCTGGQIASRLTQVPGSSDVYWGGWVVYDNSAKTSQLQVPAELIAARGAVSPEVALRLAEGGLKQMMEASPAERALCVTTTGVAGPSGGTATKPVGLCYVGLAATGAAPQVREVRLSVGGAREANQRAFADAAFEEIRKLLEEWENT